MFEKSNVLVLLDRLRRQALDVIVPVLALVAAGQVTGVDSPSILAVLAGGAAVTVLSWAAGGKAAAWRERLVVTAAGSALAVLGTDWTSWLAYDSWRTPVVAILGSIALSLLRSVTSQYEITKE
jgi:hypothetical protein